MSKKAKVERARLVLAGESSDSDSDADEKLKSKPKNAVNLKSKMPTAKRTDENFRDLRDQINETRASLSQLPGGSVLSGYAVPQQRRRHRPSREVQAPAARSSRIDGASHHFSSTPMFSRQSPKTEHKTGNTKIAVQEVVSPSNFYFTYSSDIEDLAQLTKDLGEFYENNWMRHELPIDFDDWEDFPCAAFYESVWYRGRVVKLDHVNEIAVFLYDYGTTATLMRTDIFYLANHFREQPPFAHKAVLRDCKSRSEDSGWSSRANQRFFELCRESHQTNFHGHSSCRALITEANEDTNNVTLDIMTKEEQWLSTVLVKEGFSADPIFGQSFEFAPICTSSVVNLKVRKPKDALGKKRADDKKQDVDMKALKAEVKDVMKQQSDLITRLENVWLMLPNEKDGLMERGLFHQRKSVAYLQYWSKNLH